MKLSPSLIDSVASTTAHRDRDDLNHALAQLVQQFLEATSVAVLKVFDDAGTARVECCVSIVEGGTKPNDSFFRSANNDALSVVDAWQRCATQRQMIQTRQPSGNWQYVFPIEGERTLIGLLEIEISRSLSNRDISLVSGVLRILKNHLALLDYGECDTLTGLLNRKTFEARFDKARQRMLAPRRSSTSDEPGWLAEIDIDKFKSINDTYGHLFGDEVLLLVSQLMKQSFRGADLLFRFGGEEFVIVLDHASAAGAAIAFERLRETIDAHRFPQVGHVTISVGYTQLSPSVAPSSCLERADAALYYAKHHGRNNVSCYETLVGSGALVPKSDNSTVDLF